jgi:hypothetical protein
MNVPKLIAILATALSLGAVSPTYAGLRKAASDAETISHVTTKTPQAAPFFALLAAAKLSDSAAMKNAYSQRIRDEPLSCDWNKNLKEAQASISELFGDYNLAQFDFAFIGDTLKGKLSIFHNGKQAPALNVVKEANQWKLDER